MSGVVYSFTRWTDNVDTAYANDVNELQAAIEELSTRDADSLLPAQGGKNGQVLATTGSFVQWEPPGYEPVYRWKSGRWYSLQQLLMSDFGSTFVMTANEIYATPLWVPRGSGLVDQVGFAVSSGVSGASARLMYFAQGADGHPGALLFDFGTVSVTSGGDKTISGSWTLPPGPGWLAVVPSAAITCGAFFAHYFGPLGGSAQATTDCSPHRANGGTTAPNPFGTSGISYVGNNFPRLAVRAA